MKISLKLPIFAALLATVITSSLVFTGHVAHASSPYDNINVTQTLSLQTYHYGSTTTNYANCDLHNMTTTWSEVIRDNTSYSGLSAAYAAALDHGSRAVSQWTDWTRDETNQWGYQKSIIVQFSDTKDAYLGWYTDGDGNHNIYYANSVSPPMQVTIGLDANCNPYVSNYTQNSTVLSNDVKDPPSSYYFIKRDLFFSDGTTNHNPDGYAGPNIPETGGPIADNRPILQPQFDYRVSNKHVAAKDTQQNLPSFTPDAGYTINGYSVEWSLFKCTTWDDTSKLCDTPTQQDYKILPQDTEYGFDVSDYGEYRLQAAYQVQECYRYPSYPATPDNCFYVDLSTELTSYHLTSTSKHLKIDGNAFSGQTSAEVCNESGYCEPAQETCESLTDYGARFNCNIQKQFKNDYGLTSVISSPITLLTNLTNQTYTCSPVILPLPFIDQNLPLPCLSDFYSQKMGALYTIYQTIVTGVISYYILLGVLTTVKGIKDPQNDKIEAVKL